VVGVSGVRFVGAAGTTPFPFDHPPLNYYPHASGANDADVLALRAGAEATGIDFTLHVPAPPGTRPVEQSPTVRRDGAGAIRGRILRADGLPARSARVELSSADRLFSPFNTATDADGRYQFTGLKPGRYLMAATDPTAMTTARFGQRGSLDRGDIINVAPGGAVDGVDVSMPRVSVIGGRVVDEYGDAIENANVRLQQIEWSRGRRKVASVPGVASRDTDEQGRYRMFGIPPGRYVVSAVVGQAIRGTMGKVNNLPGYVRTYFPGTPIATDAQLLDISAGDQPLNVNFALSKGLTGQIAGRVLTADGQPFRGAVNLVASARSGAVAGEAPETRRTSDGTFVFDRLPLGEYVVQAATSRKSRSNEGEFGLQFVTVSGARPVDVAIRMSAGSSLVGRVMFNGEPPANAHGIELAAVPSDPDFASIADNPFARAEIHDDWTFDMDGLNGPRRLALLAAPDGWTVERISLDGEDVTDAPLLLGNSVVTSNVEVVLTSNVAQVSGVVSDGNRAPAPDVAVLAFATDRHLWFDHSRFVSYVRSSLDGGFDLRGLPPGGYYLVAVDTREFAEIGQQISNPEFLGTLTGAATRITLEQAQHSRINLRLSTR